MAMDYYYHLACGSTDQQPLAVVDGDSLDACVAIKNQHLFTLLATSVIGSHFDLTKELPSTMTRRRSCPHTGVGEGGWGGGN